MASRNYEVYMKKSIQIILHKFLFIWLFLPFAFQEQQKEAEELKQQVQDYQPKEEECTIRTNSQPEPPVTDPMTNR